uniref:PH domain-containing protein n=1 Tax=Cyanistes caeruleus TaxID=156563 RepID=A0A8C0VAT7_CYACU
MGGKIKTWKKRWFVFDRNKRTFTYYAGRLQDCYKGTSVFLFSYQTQLSYEQVRSPDKTKVSISFIHLEDM